MINDPVDPSAYIVRNVERTIGSHRQARGTMFGFGRRLHRSGETIRKYFALTGCAVPVELLKNYVVAALRVWRPVPRPVKGDENAIAIVRRKLLLVVQDHGVWRPMRRKCRNRSN